MDLGSLPPPVDDHPTISFCNAATKTLRRGEREQPPNMGSVDALSLLAHHREVPTAAIDQLRQRSDTRITTTSFDGGNRRLWNPRADGELALRKASDTPHFEKQIGVETSWADHEFIIALFYCRITPGSVAPRWRPAGLSTSVGHSSLRGVGGHNKTVLLGFCGRILRRPSSGERRRIVWIDTSFGRTF